MTVCPMPKTGGIHRFTGGWAAADGPPGQTCRACHQSWFRRPDGALALRR